MKKNESGKIRSVSVGGNVILIEWLGKALQRRWHLNKGLKEVRGQDIQGGACQTESVKSCGHNVPGFKKEQGLCGLTGVSEGGESWGRWCQRKRVKILKGLGGLQGLWLLLKRKERVLSQRVTCPDLHFNKILLFYTCMFASCSSPRISSQNFCLCMSSVLPLSHWLTCGFWFGAVTTVDVSVYKPTVT